MSETEQITEIKKEEVKHVLPLEEIWKIIEEKGLNQHAEKIEYGTGRKKYKITLKDGKKIQFGDVRYEDYLMHKDEKRRELYRARHKHDKIEDPTKAGFWSWNLLW